MTKWSVHASFPKRAPYTEVRIFSYGKSLFFLRKTPFKHMHIHIHVDQLRSAQISSDQLRSVEISSDQRRLIQISSDQFRSAQINSDRLRSAQISTDPIRSAQISSDQLRSAQISSDLLRSAQIRPNRRALWTEPILEECLGGPYGASPFVMNVSVGPMDRAHL